MNTRKSKKPLNFMPFLWISLSALVLKSLSAKIFDPDLWWHLNAGREMVLQKGFLREDVFSYTLFGSSWINFEWLSQLIFYAIYQGVGLPGIYVGKVVLGFLCWLMLVVVIRKIGAKGAFLFFLSWVGFEVLRPRLLTRPELASLLFLSFVVLVVFDAMKKNYPHQKYLLGLTFFVTVLWTNLHGGFIYGLGLAGLFLIGAFTGKLSPQVKKRLFQIVAVMFIGTLVNPYGPKIYLVLWDHLLQLRQGTSLIIEWQPPTFEKAQIFWIFFFVCGFSLVYALLERKKRVYFWFLPLLVFAAWSQISFRNTSLLVYVGLPFLVFVYKEAKWIPKAKWILVLLPLLILGRHLTKPFPDTWVAWSRFPVKAAEYLKEKDLKGEMYNDYNFGSYLSWANPKQKIFMDGRYIFYPLLQSTFKNILDTKKGNNNWQSFFDRYEATYAVVSYVDLPVGAVFPQDKWALVFWDDVACVFLKRTENNKKWIDQDEYKVLRPYDFEGMRELLSSGQISKEAVLKELGLHKKRVGFTVIGGEIQKVLL